jgi:hypothetical protein
LIGREMALRVSADITLVARMRLDKFTLSRHNLPSTYCVWVSLARFASSCQPGRCEQHAPRGL